MMELGNWTFAMTHSKIIFCKKASLSSFFLSKSLRTWGYPWTGNWRGPCKVEAVKCSVSLWLMSPGSAQPCQPWGQLVQMELVRREGVIMFRKAMRNSKGKEPRLFNSRAGRRQARRRVKGLEPGALCASWKRQCVVRLQVKRWGLTKGDGTEKTVREQKQHTEHCEIEKTQMKST